MSDSGVSVKNTYVTSRVLPPFHFVLNFVHIFVVLPTYTFSDEGIRQEKAAAAPASFHEGKKFRIENFTLT